jgi:glutathione S-transferase
MIVVHHLNTSRSQRVLWLLEELGVPYELKRYQRDPSTRMAPPNLGKVHPLGKSPVITDDGRTVHESGAIIDYIIRRHGAGRLSPRVGSDAYEDYNQWMHYAEGSAMLPIMLNVYVGGLGEAGAPLRSRISGELAKHLGYIEKHIEPRAWLVDEKLSGADINLSFVCEAAGAMGQLEPYDAIRAWLGRCQARPAYRAAIEKGGGFTLAQG